jgi:hypothetical protein
VFYAFSPPHNVGEKAFFMLGLYNSNVYGIIREMTKIKIVRREVDERKKRKKRKI